MLVLVSAVSSNQDRCFFGTRKYLYTILRGGKILLFGFLLNLVFGRNSQLIFNFSLLCIFILLCVVQGEGVLLLCITTFKSFMLPKPRTNCVCPWFITVVNTNKKIHFAQFLPYF